MAAFDLTWTKIGSLIAAYLAYQLLKALYRLTFHPLAKFPGPKLAALSYKYEFYWDGVKNGQYTNKIKELHRQYGPIVRINPDELHCNDPKFIDQIYAGSGARRDKSGYFLAGFGPKASGSVFATRDHNLHRNRRSAINHFFSKASISKLQPLIHELAQKLCDKLLERSGNPEPLNATSAYSCFTSDVITTYCFGQSHGFLEQDGFTVNLRTGIHAGCQALTLAKQLPWLFLIIDNMPDAIAKSMSAEVATFIDYMNSLIDHVRQVKIAWDSGKDSSILDKPSIFRHLLSSNLPENEKTEDRLGAEATGLIGAGLETTAWTLVVATFHILSNPEVLKRLEAELLTIVTDSKSLPEWSNAVIIESIRLSYGVATRLARVAPDEALNYSGIIAGKHYEYAIPPGTPVSMTSVIQHADESIFPNADDFVPDRWLKEDGTRRTDLEKFMISFSRGSRQCIGINLAYCELYVGLSALILRVFPHMELYKTSIDDVRFYRDMFIPMPVPESEGVQILVR